jgi:hypothetical protein
VGCIGGLEQPIIIGLVTKFLFLVDHRASIEVNIPQTIVDVQLPESSAGECDRVRHDVDGIPLLDIEEVLHGLSTTRNPVGEFVKVLLELGGVNDFEEQKAFPFLCKSSRRRSGRSLQSDYPWKRGIDIPLDIVDINLVIGTYPVAARKGKRRRSLLVLFQEIEECSVRHNCTPL